MLPYNDLPRATASSAPTRTRSAPSSWSRSSRASATCRGSGVPARDPEADRGAQHRPDLRRGAEPPRRAGRRPGALRRDARSLLLREDHRRRAADRRLRRPPGHHGPVRSTAAGGARIAHAGHVQREPDDVGRGRGGHARADAAALPAAGRAGRVAPPEAPPDAPGDGGADPGHGSRVAVRDPLQRARPIRATATSWWTTPR